MAVSVLVIEDDHCLRDMICLGLDSVGYSAAESRGAEALYDATRLAPSLILLDVKMPDMDGATVCRLLRSNERTAHIPIIAVTGGEVPASMRVDDVLVKPFTMHELLRLVRHWIGLPQPGREPALPMLVGSR